MGGYGRQFYVHVFARGWGAVRGKKGVNFVRYYGANVWGQCGTLDSCGRNRNAVKQERTRLQQDSAASRV
jgi:hypothetical protein